MAREVDNWMWAEALALIDQAERRQRAMFQPGTARRPASCWEPPVDVFETDDEIWIQVALPGVPLERLEVVLEGGTLVIGGERPLPLPGGAGVIHRLEIPHGRFERRLPLPGGRYALGRRDLVNGCLTLSLRKKIG
jgi:HSP20 family molecular chaperone IbpA